MERFEAFGLVPGSFDHPAHLRMAYTYLCEDDPETVHRNVRATICGWLTHLGVAPATKYHETLTGAWIRLVGHALSTTPVTASAEAFLEACPHLLDSGLLLQHYSKERFASEAARERFLEPDLKPLPSPA